MMTLLETIYRGKLLNKEMTADFLKMLSNTRRVRSYKAFQMTWWPPASLAS